MAYFSVYKNYNNYLLVLLSFFITISIYVTDIIIILLCLSWLISGGLKRKLKYIFSNPITCATICFFIYFLLSYLWSDSEIWNNTTKKQLLILLLPILYTLDFNQNYIEKAKYGFLLGLSLNIILSVFTYIKPLNTFFKTGHYSNDVFAHGFLDHFDYSLFLCFGIFLILTFLNKKKPYLIYIAILFLIALLNSYGRIGIICFFIFFPMMLLALKKSKWKLLLIIIALSSSIFGYYMFSPFSNRVNETIENVRLLYNPPSFEEKVESDALYLSNDTLSKTYFIEKILEDEAWMEEIKNKNPQYETSLGKRYVYLQNSIELITKKPFFGFGANQFNIVYNKHFTDKEINHILHPHNNFIFIIIELGIVGFVLLLSIFFFHIKAYFLSTQKHCLKFIFPLFFLFIMMFDNYFLNHNTLAFFCLFSFIFYRHDGESGESIHNKFA